MGDEYLGDKAQGQFCLVNLQVKNVGNQPIFYSEENQALVDTKGKTYSPDDEAWIYMTMGRNQPREHLEDNCAVRCLQARQA